MSEKVIKGKENFALGHNCAQAVVSAFEEIPNYGELIKAASSFGGGVGGKRQICGATSGMCMIAGVKMGYNTHEKGDRKKEHTKLISQMCDEFIAQAGSMTCGELLGEDGFAKIDRKLSCADLVQLGIEIAEKYTK